MNCRDAQEVLPLQAGGDLGVELARSVAEHVRSCTECAAAAADLAEARELLRDYEAPDFDDAFYADLRRSVIDRIASGQSRTPWRWMAGLSDGAGGSPSRPRPRCSCRA
jgi:hypothetical protein